MGLVAASWSLWVATGFLMAKWIGLTGVTGAVGIGEPLGVGGRSRVGDMADVSGLIIGELLILGVEDSIGSVGDENAMGATGSRDLAGITGIGEGAGSMIGDGVLVGTLTV